MPATSTGLGALTAVFDNLGATITTAYTGNQATFNTHGATGAEIFIDYTLGLETSVQVQVEVWDATNGWFIVPYLAFVGTSSAFAYSASASAKARWSIKNLARFETQMRISVKNIGTQPTATTKLTVRVQLNSTTFPISGNIT